MQPASRCARDRLTEHPSEPLLQPERRVKLPKQLSLQFDEFADESVEARSNGICVFWLKWHAAVERDGSFPPLHDLRLQVFLRCNLESGLAPCWRSVRLRAVACQPSREDCN